jgi:hypothetical protein
MAPQRGSSPTNPRACSRNPRRLHPSRLCIRARSALSSWWVAAVAAVAAEEWLEGRGAAAFNGRPAAARRRPRRRRPGRQRLRG